MSPVHACKKESWPVLYTPDFVQDACNGYHNLVLMDPDNADKLLLCSGWIVNGIPEGMCSVCWPDGSEFHGPTSCYIFLILLLPNLVDFLYLKIIS